ncbi:MAG TPA: DoxX family membrane protein [Rhodanobacteraceae bacterium]
MNAVMRQGHAVSVAATQGIGAGRVLLALVMIGLGVRGLVFGDFAGTWQRIPIAHLPAHAVFVYVTAAVELACGIGLLVPRMARAAAAVMAVFTLLWMVLLKFPALFARPGMEAVWLGAGEIAVILAGAWTAFALLNPRASFLTGPRGVTWARLMLVLALPTIGLSHFVYAGITATFIPAWLPWHGFWVGLTGAGNIAAALVILLGVWSRLAATLEAAMLMDHHAAGVVAGVVRTPCRQRGVVGLPDVGGDCRRRQRGGRFVSERAMAWTRAVVGSKRMT